jgi:2-hydroxychromene-2-carboxylate isomerase
MQTNKLLTREEAAGFLRIRPQTLAVWAMTGRNVPFVKIGRAVRYQLSDLERLIERSTVASTATTPIPNRGTK